METIIPSDSIKFLNPIPPPKRTELEQLQKHCFFFCHSFKNIDNIVNSGESH